MLRDYMGIINLEESERDIRSLTVYRPIGTVPVAARYRSIDFMLSNLVNAGISRVSVFAKKSTRSLIDHLGSGRPWDLDRKIDGLFTFHNSILGASDTDARLFGSTMEYINSTKFDYVIVSSSYMICNIDLEEVAEYHERTGADITVVYKTIHNAEDNFLNCDTIKMDQRGRVINVSKNIGIEQKVDVCMEIFVMKRRLLTELMYKALSQGVRSNFKNVIYHHIMSYHVQGYAFDGYLQCINSVDSYYKANMEMLQMNVMGELFAKNHPIYTKTKDSPPTQYIQGSDVQHSIVADGCVIKGRIVNSVIFRSVIVEEGASLEGCIILPNARIRKGAKLTNVIVDKWVSVDENVIVQCPKEYPVVFEKKQYSLAAEK